MAEYLIKGTTLTSIADAIREKTGTSEEMKTVDFPDKIRSIATGGDEEIGVKSKAVNFYDQFGNIMYSYTRAEAAALTELPPGPEIEGFEFDTWTYTLSQVQSVKFFADICPMYKKNGKSCAVLILDVPVHELSTYLCMEIVEHPGVSKFSIDWGDGTIDSILGHSTQRIYTQQHHTYSEPGVKYVAVYSLTVGGMVGLGYTQNSNSYSVLMNTTTSYINQSSHSKIDFKPEYKLIAGLGCSTCTFSIVSGHQNLKIISDVFVSMYNCIDVTICHSPSLEIIASSGAAWDVDNKCAQYAPKLRRVLLSTDSDITDDVLLYSDNMTDIYIGTKLFTSGSIYLLSKMNVGRRMVINSSTPPRLNSAITNVQWGDGLIYVPDSSVETYKANELFAPVVDYIRPISEYPDY